MKWILALRETIPVFFEEKREALITNLTVSPWRADLRRNLPTLLLTSSHRLDMLNLENPDG